jgi:hypothetical protein
MGDQWYIYIYIYEKKGGNIDRIFQYFVFLTLRLKFIICQN